MNQGRRQKNFLRFLKWLLKTITSKEAHRRKLGRLRKKGRWRLLEQVKDICWVKRGTGEIPVNSHSSVGEERPSIEKWAHSIYGCVNAIFGKYFLHSKRLEHLADITAWVNNTSWGHLRLNCSPMSTQPLLFNPPLRELTGLWFPMESTFTTYAIA